MIYMCLDDWGRLKLKLRSKRKLEKSFTWISMEDARFMLGREICDFRFQLRPESLRPQSGKILFS